MASILRWRVGLTGFPGSPGVNTLFTQRPAGWDQDQLDGVSALLEAAYTSLKQFYINGVDITLDPVVTQLEDTDGAMTDVFSAPGWTIHSSAAGDTKIPRSTMAKLRLNTAEILNRRILRGGPFLGPLNEDALNGDGSLAQSFKDAAVAAFGGLTDAPGGVRLVVWSRPVVDPETEEIERPGASADVRTITIGDLPAVLRSRRD